MEENTRSLTKFIMDSNYRFISLARRGLLNWVPDDMYLKKMYKALIGEKLDLRCPKSFNEKIQWLKLYDHNRLYSILADKIDVKEYISKIIGEQYIIKTLAVWESSDEIDISSLPEKFVLKCNHDGGVIPCKNKASFDLESAKKELDRRMKRNYFYWGREWCYKNIKPRILAEEYMENELDKEGDLLDYKLMCFNGKVKCSFVCSERFSGTGLKVTFFDNDWNVMPFERHYPKSKRKIARPKHFEEMIMLAEKLSEGIPFVRVDFYEINNRVYFGEMTFYPGNGFEEFTPKEWDYKIGSWIKLPERQS